MNIRDIEKIYLSVLGFDETVNHHFEIENNEYINIIDSWFDLGNATVGIHHIRQSKCW